ncbi:MAG: hypothetical protein WBG67_07890 [Thermoanaerobaculia bacterium]
MEHTEEQKQQFKSKFSVLRKRQLMAAVPVVAVIAFVALADQTTGEAFGISPMVWGPAVVIYFVGLIAFSIRNWRCPACDKYLGKGFSPKYCPKCGAPLA